MKSEERHQIKQDELLTGYERAAHWVGTHRDETRVTLLAIAVVGLAALGITTWRSHQHQASEKSFSDALRLFHSPVSSEIAPGAPAPSGTVFATAQERYTKAREAFDGVAREYGSTRAGRRARYYTALCDVELGNHAAAEKALSDLAASKDEETVAGLARLALAETHRRRGQVDQAVAAFTKLVDEKGTAVPADHALMRLAATLEDARRTAEASRAYKRLADEFPTSVYAAEARRKADHLGDRG